MGQEQSTLQKKGYKIEKETEDGIIAIKDGDRFFIKQIQISTNAELIPKMEILQAISHPHFVSSKNSFKDKDQNTYYVVMEHCQGGTLAEKIRRSESEVLSWIVEICMALKAAHEKGLLHEEVTPQNIFLTEFGKLCMGGFWKIRESSNNTAAINYLAPEVFTQPIYDAKSEIWSVGCILYELCSQQLAFSAENPVKLIQKIISDPEPCLQGTWSLEFRELLSDMLKRDPDSRPTVCEILERPIILRCLTKKSKTTIEHLQTQLDKLKTVADGLESMHKGTTIGSLTGGVIGAVGGITSIVGIILAPFTLGASLIVTGVGVGVGLAGGVTAGVSNITNMVNQSTDRKAVRSIIKEFDEKITAVTLWLEQISASLQAISSRYSGDMPADEDNFNQENRAKFGMRVGRGMGELIQILRLATIGKIIAQASKVARVAEVASGALSGLFVAADIFFIAMDAKEIHHIRQTGDGQTRSEIMKFVQSIRRTAKELQDVLDELKNMIATIPSQL